MSRTHSTRRRSTSPIRPSRARRRSTAPLDRLCDRAEAAVHGGYNIIILSDRLVGPDRIPIPALLATAAVHNYLIRKGLRTSVGLVVESGEPREVHHFACLAGYGAEAINPYLAFETMLDMHERGELPDEVDGQGGRQALHQVDRQGPAQGDVQDGHLDLPVLLRRADLRRRRPVLEVRRPRLLRHRDDDRGRRHGRDRRGDGAAPSRRLRRFAGLPRPRSTSAASMPSASAARTMSGTPTRCATCSMPCAATCRTSTAPSRRASTSRMSASSPSAACSTSRTRRRTGATPVPLEEVEPAADIVRASRPARCRSARSRARRTRRSPSP